MFLHVGSGTNESTMRDFFTGIKSLHILGDFSKLRVVEFEDTSTSFHGQKSRFGSCVFIHGASTSIKELHGFQKQFVTPARRLGDRDIPGHVLGKRSQTESECSKTETEIGTPARVEAET